MSEYVSKKAVLEWLNENIKDQDWPYEIRYAFKHVREKIQSGAFDADDSEVQRLRAALESIALIKYEALGYSPEDAECMNRIAVEVLSGTEPTGAQRAKEEQA